MRKFNILFTPLVIFFSSQAQDVMDKNDSDYKKHSYFKVTASYLNDNVYLGRKDSTRIPYINPGVGYFFKSGLFFSGTLNYLSTENRVDNASLGVGWRFEKDKWDGEIAAEKYFYNDESYNVKSETKGNMSALFCYDAGFIQPGISLSLDFASATDYMAAFSLEHSFSMADDKLEVTPSAILNAGTQNLYSLYYQQKKYKKRKRGNGNNSYTITAQTLNASRFKILDYETSLPIEYKLNKFVIGFIPTISIPENPNVVVLTIQNGNGSSVTKTFTEKLGTSFYFELALEYKF